MKQITPDGMPRRDFIRATGAAALGLPLHGCANNAKPSGSMQYRTLGRTGLRVSEIGFGGYPTKDPDVVPYAIDKGINYFDTAWCYSGGLSESTIGKGLKGRRDKVILTTKWHPWATTRADEMMEMLNTSLKRLKTDYVDGLLVHNLGQKSGQGEGVERIKNPELFRAIEMAKKQGKARYFGCSGHAGDLMEIMEYAITIPEFSIILCRYNFMSYPTQPELFKQAKAAGVGVVAMKTLSGARGQDLDAFRDKRDSFKQAALKWVLSNPNVSNLIISMSNKRQVDEYAKASGAPITASEWDALQDYAARFNRQVCRMCDACESVCPENVLVADILRYRMYEQEYALTGEGKRLYRLHARQNYASACTACNGPCLAACAYGIDIPGELKEAHRLLTA